MKRKSEKILIFQLLVFILSMINPTVINANSVIRAPEYDHNTSLNYGDLYVEENHVVDTDPGTINNLLKLVPELNPYYIENGKKVYVKDSSYSIENLILTPTAFNIAKGSPNTIEIEMNLIYKASNGKIYVFRDTNNNVSATLSVGTNPFMTFDYSHTRFKKGQYVGNNLAEIYGAHAYHFVNGKVEEIAISHISESSQLDGYTPGLKHVYFQVEADGQTTNEYTSIEVVEELDIQAIIDLQKVDEDGNPLAGAVFEVEDPNGKIIESNMITDENGYASIIVDQKGTYTIREIKAPNGYELSNPPFSQTVEVTTHGQTITLNNKKGIVNTKIQKGKIDLNKVDQDNKPLANAVFGIFDASGKQVDTLTTDKNGYASSIDLNSGTYTVKELTAPSGYELNHTSYQVTIVAGKTVSVNNGKPIINYEIGTISPEKPLVPDVDIPVVAPREGFIDLLKVDQDNKPLAGAEFTVYDESGKKVSVITTDAKGHAMTKALAQGKYTVVETKAPTGYELNRTKFSVEIKTTGEFAHVNAGKGIVNNKIYTISPDRPLNPDVDIPVVAPREGFIDLLKVDQDNNRLAGAEFTVYDENGKKVSVITTDAKGHAMTDALALGKYTVVETKAPTGYELNRTKFSVEIKTTGEFAHVNAGKGIVNNKIHTISPDRPLNPDIDIPVVAPREGFIDLLKVDQDNNRLAGAEFTVYDENGKTVSVITTDAKGHAMTDALALGKYTVVETKAPTGYELNRTKFSVEIKTTGEFAHVNAGKGIVNNKIESITPEKPVVVDPDKPDVVDPDKPTEPITPEQPDVVDPNKPTEPITPEQPEVVNPDKPTEPITPEQPEVVVPDKPSKPVAPEINDPKDNIKEDNNDSKTDDKVSKPVNKTDDIDKTSDNKSSDKKADDQNKSLENTSVKIGKMFTKLLLLLIGVIVFIKLRSRLSN